jgi:hypothetical protein
MARLDLFLPRSFSALQPANTDAKYQYRLTEIVLAYTISAPK